jgi:hypothetical protein
MNYTGGIMKKTLTGLILLFSIGFVFAQTVFTATYTFGADGNVSSFAYNGTAYDGITMGTIDKVGVTTSSSTGNFRATNWPTGATNASDVFTGVVDTEKYIGFTISAAPGYKFSVGAITFGVGRSGTGTRQSQWRGSSDSYASILSTYGVVNAGLTNTGGVLTNPDLNSNWTGNILLLSTEYEDQTGTVSFRYYLYNAESTAGTAGLQGPITIQGTYQPISGNLPPVISNVMQNPAEDITSTTTVSVFADVVDNDGTVAAVSLFWGTVENTYPNSIQMLPPKGTYATTSNIPGQPHLTTVYYVVYAQDNEGAWSYSLPQSYTVLDPVTTALPYNEPFDTSLGDCYVYSVSGDTKGWVYGVGGYAYINGYNSGDVEEDWLILPGIDFSGYSDVYMTFNTYYNYGTDNDTNYLKLMYSTDYLGIGDPTLATWTELPFVHPTATTTWTPSGTVDLSSITDPSVWFGFKYRYESGMYRLWQVDDILIEETPLAPVIYTSVPSLSGFTYVVGNGPSDPQSFTASGSNLTGDITVTPPVDYELSLVSDSGYSQVPIVLPQTGGDVSATTIYVRLLAGLPIAAYNAQDIVLSSPGADNKTVTCNGEVTSPLPSITEVLMPQFMQGVNGTNNQRIPWACRLTLDNLTPSATYRYFGMYVQAADSPTTNGAGVGWFVDADGTFRRSTSLNLGTLGQYGEFTTDATGSFTGWFMGEPSGNARFTPGNNLWYRIMINDGEDGTAIAQRLTSTSSIHVINFGTEENVNQGTFLYGISQTPPKSFVFLYDNVSGTGRPIAGNVIESDGLDLSAVTQIEPLYRSNVDGVANAWGVIIPNSTTTKLFAGIQNIATYLLGGSLFSEVTDDDGIWPGGGNTVNPTGGDTTPIVMGNYEETLPVELSSFTAVLTSELFVELAWVVQSETGHLGYNILRGNSDLPAGAITVNESIITSDYGTAQGTQISYVFTDSEVDLNTTYYYWLESVDLGGGSVLYGPLTVLVTGDPDDPGIPPLPPTVTRLLPAYPNPFNPSTNIRYALKEGARVKIEIFNTRGQLMRLYENDYSDPGYYQIMWDGRDARGNAAPSGVYLYRMTSGKYATTKKMVLAK